MKRLKHNFSTEDARYLINLARSAPLQNMATAEAVARLLARFAEFARATLVKPIKVKNDVPPTGQ